MEGFLSRNIIRIPFSEAVLQFVSFEEEHHALTRDYANWKHEEVSLYSRERSGKESERERNVTQLRGSIYTSGCDVARFPSEMHLESIKHASLSSHLFLSLIVFSCFFFFYSNIFYSIFAFSNNK